MKKTNLLAAIFLFLLFLNSCGTVADGLAGGKKKSSDEFLVKKKAPLVLPPNFGKLPEPGIKKDENLEVIKKNTLDIKDIITQSSSVDTEQTNNNSNTSIEESILKEIKKKKIKELNSDIFIEEKTEIPEKEGFFKRLKSKIKKVDQ